MGLSVVAIVLIVVGALMVTGALVYLVWPMIESWKKSDPLATTLTKRSAPETPRAGTELPPLLTPA